MLLISSRTFFCRKCLTSHCTIKRIQITKVNVLLLVCLTTKSSCCLPFFCWLYVAFKATEKLFRSYCRRLFATSETNELNEDDFELLFFRLLQTCHYTYFADFPLLLIHYVLYCNTNRDSSLLSVPVCAWMNSESPCLFMLVSLSHPEWCKKYSSLLFHKTPFIPQLDK